MLIHAQHDAPAPLRPLARAGGPTAEQPVRPFACDNDRTLRASAIRSAFSYPRGEWSLAAIVAAFGLDALNDTHVRRVQRWLADGAPFDAIAMLPADVRARYLDARHPEMRRAA